MSKRRIVALGSVIVLAIAWSAWTWWPPVLRFRLRQIDQRTDRVMVEFLDGKRDFAAAARTLADLWDTAYFISLRLPPVDPTARIEDPRPGALEEHVGDPRLKDLVDSASQTDCKRCGMDHVSD